MNFWEKTERFSPCLCRLLARTTPNGPPVTNEALAVKLKLPVYQVVALSQQLDWSGIDLPTMRRFIEACGVDFEDPATYQRMVVYMRGKKVKGHRIAPPFSYLRSHQEWESFFKPLTLRFLAHARQQKHPQG